VTPAGVTLHAGCVAVGGRGLLILGPSGSGKSALALQLIALGAGLVADDRTDVTRAADGLTARCPPALSGMIEARGLGILHAPVVSAAKLVLAVDLGVTETERLPPFRHVDVLGVELPLVRAQQGSHFHAALLHYLRFGRHS
jgi:HPr kinase/phosphorylase